MSSKNFWEKLEKQEKEKDLKLTRSVLEQMTKETFEIFDHDSSGTVDITDLGHIVRSLGINPSQKELKDLAFQMMEQGKVHFAKFQPIMVNSLLENKFIRDDENKIKKAFQVIDIEKKGYIEAEKLAALLTTHGEIFSQEEIDDMFAVTLNPEQSTINYEEYSNTLAND